MNSEQKERLRLSLSADGRAGLYDLLAAAAGATLAGRFLLDELFAAGRQSILFSATDQSTGERVLVKQPAFDYERPIKVSRAEAARARQAVRMEYTVLGACTTGHLPRPIALVVAPSPIPAARDFNILGREKVFVVEERIQGLTLEQAAMAEWPQLPAERREQAARQICREVLQFWSALRKGGYHYSDTSARNILLEGGTGRVRVVDAACVQPAGDTVIVSECTAAFLTPSLHEAVTAGRPISGSLAGLIPVLAKVLHFALSRRQPFDGGMPDLDVPEMSPYSPLCRAALRAMAEVDGEDRRLSQALSMMDAWAGAQRR